MKLSTSRLYLLILSIFILNTSLFAQNSVPFLNKIPLIDGKAEHTLSTGKLNKFKVIKKTDKNNEDIEARYYLGYNESYLYLYMEIDSNNLTIRDRAYQNGDGFHLVIGMPQKDNSPTDEFYVLGFSPDKRTWCHKFCWYYNIDLGMERLDEKTLFETNNDNGKVSYELLLPWNTIPPYHPWITKSIGFNLCLVKAIGKKDKTYYFAKYDRRIQSEQSKRKYIILNFEKPDANTSIETYIKKKNIKEGESPVITFTGNSLSQIDKEITVKIYSGENSFVTRQYHNITTNKGLFTKNISIDNVNLITGGYKLKIYNGNKQIGEHFISVLPKVNTSDFIERLNKIKLSISEGTYNTLMFHINNLDDRLKSLKEYECSFKIRETISSIDKNISSLENNNDLLTEKEGTFRRAFRSAIDNTYRPYSIYVPDNFNPDKTYPLLVYLHGSGNDDTVLEATPKIDNDTFIIIAPNGRGTSNCFATTDSQTDIIESIDDVCKNYKIDTSKIILSGFSMGGYGVYRTYYEHPELFKAISVISGHPNLAQLCISKDEISFLDKKNLKTFKNIPIYIFHGREDLNCPYDLTLRFVKLLKDNHCQVTFDVDNGGHGGMKEENRNNYYKWLKSQIK